MKAVILAGGTGTRLWPLSRKSKPKQFQALASQKTLFQEALDRIDFLKPEDIYVATNENFVEIVHQQAPQIPQENIILEPALRDTASCIGLAAAMIAHKHPEEVMAVIYADHLIQDKTELQQKLKIAEQIAQEAQTLNIIEVNAKFPNVNLGYVEVGETLETLDGVEVKAFKRFREKPDLETAKKFQEAGNFLWNTGLYVWRVDVLLEKYKAHLPDTHKKLMHIQGAIGKESFKSTLESEYSTCQKISIDYAIMEKVDPNEVRIIPADLGWSDIGTWLSLHEELTDSPTENLIDGNVLTQDTEGCIILNKNKETTIATIGLNDLAIIHTGDAILICDKNKSQDVKKVVNRLQEQEKTELL